MLEYATMGLPQEATLGSENPSHEQEEASPTGVAPLLLKVGDLLLRLDRQPREPDGCNRVSYLSHFENSDKPGEPDGVRTSFKVSTLLTVQRGENGSVVINSESKRVDLGYRVPVVSPEEDSSETGAMIQFHQSLTPEEERVEEVRRAFQEMLLEGERTTFVFQKDFIEQGRIPTTRLNLVSGETTKTDLDFKLPLADENLNTIVHDLYFNCMSSLMDQMDTLPDDHPIKAEWLDSLVSLFESY